MKLYGNTSSRYKTHPADASDAAEGRKEKKPLKTVLIVIGIIIAVLVLAYLFLHIFYVKAPEINKADGKVTVNTSSNRKSNFFTFVLCGTDKGDSRTDTIMVASFDVDKKKVNIVSVPRDTILNKTWSVKKINSAYAYDGIDGLKDALKSVLGINVDFYAEVNLEAFIEVVDAIGGVEFDVPEDMYYEDPTQDLLIDLSEGVQRLDGEKSMELIRYRQYAMGDIKRISVQQSFMKAVFKQLLNIGNITKINQLADIFEKYMDTDLSSGNLIWFGEKLLGVKSEDVNTYTLPGGAGNYEGLSYWHLDAEKVVEMVNDYLNPYKKDITLKDLDIVNALSGTLVSETGRKVLDPTPDYYEEEPEVTPTPSGSPAPSASPSVSANPSASPAPSGKPSASPAVSAKPDATPAPTQSAMPVPSTPPATVPSEPAAAAPAASAVIEEKPAA